MPPQTSAADIAQLNRAAKTLIANQRTLVLATSINGSPWIAPVYYVYSSPGFYFFSSARARHVAQARTNASASAAIFCDSAHWEQIQGVQMSGKLAQVTRKIEIVQITGRFLVKFPFARSFLEKSAPASIGTISDRIGLYAFFPDRVYYTKNQHGFGRRFAVSFEKEGELQPK
jgi:uncharacterized protein YhbP (UPF0306 family)